LATEGHLWQQGETLNAAIGQGYMLASPLQLATMAARIANGGKAVVPHLVKKIGNKEWVPPSYVSLGIDPHHLELVKAGLSAVVNSPLGTAYAARTDNPQTAMAGKTGTSQVRHISETERDEGVTTNENLPWKQRDHALFCGYAPLSEPRYSLAVLVEHGGSGAHVSAPIARDILVEYIARTENGVTKTPNKL
jgi:penicillin-binding protein 2